MTHMETTQDVVSVAMSIVIVFGFVLLFFIGCFGFKILDFIDNCMELEDET